MTVGVRMNKQLLAVEGLPNGYLPSSAQLACDLVPLVT